jgi:hypothetical protein
VGSSKEKKTVCGKKTKGKKGDISSITKKKIFTYFITPIYGNPLLASLTLFSSLFLTLTFHPFILSKPHTFFLLHKLSHPSSPALSLHNRLDQNSQLALALHCRPIEKYLSPKNPLPKNLSRKYSNPQTYLHLYFSLNGIPLVLITWKFERPSLLRYLVSLISKMPPIFFEIWNKGKKLDFETSAIVISTTTIWHEGPMFRHGISSFGEQVCYYILKGIYKYMSYLW